MLPQFSWYQTTRRHVQEDITLHTHSHENLNSHIVIIYEETTLCNVRRLENIRIKMALFYYLFFYPEDGVSLVLRNINICKIAWCHFPDFRNIHTL
jgi:hypothetical protein